MAGAGRDESVLVDRLDRLGDLAGRLAAASDVSDVVDVVMISLEAPQGAPSRALWLHPEPDADHLTLVAQHGLDPAACEEFARIPLDSDLPGPVAFRQRETVRSASRADANERYPELEDVARSAEGFVAVPLVVGAECYGVLVFGANEDLDLAEVVFLETVAGLLAQTLSRLRLAAALEARLEDAAEEAERERRRRIHLEFLAELTVAALHASDHVDLMRTVTAKAVPHLGDWCSIHFLSEDDASPKVVVGHVDPERLAWARELAEAHPFDRSADAGVTAVIRTGVTEHIAVVDDAVIDAAVARSSLPEAEARAVLESLGLTSAITVPLRARHGVIGAMQFVSAESGRHYDDDDVVLAEAVAARVAETLTNHWLTDQHRMISETLQRALLPPVLPSVPGLDIAARYWPAGAVTEVGGDFYDVFSSGTDTWSVVIGDACGTGPNAAALTSIARHTVRAAARHGAPHPEVVDWLNQAVLLSDRHLFCTACYATVECHAETGTWTFRSTAAGHPLPVHRPRGGAARALGRPGTLLGMFDQVANHTVSTTLAPGDIVVLYTDGVTDLRPPADLTQDGMNALVDTIPPDCTAGEAADAIRADVLARVPDRQRHDDIALVVLRVADEPPRA